MELTIQVENIYKNNLSTDKSIKDIFEINCVHKIKKQQVYIVY